MRRRLAFILTAVILLGVGIAVAVGNSGADPMVSKSYWENTYLPALAEDLQKRAGADTKAAYEAVVSKLDKAGEADLKAAQDKSGSFSFSELKAGNGLELKVGASAIIQSGESALNAGTLADVTTGSEIAAGETLQPSHRYVVLSDTAMLRQSKAGTVAYQGTGTVVKDPGGTANPGGTTPGTPPPADMPFRDVAREQWFYDAVAFVYEKGYFSGTGTDTFAPNEPMNRAMVATVLHRLAGSETVSSPDLFADVPAGQWYSQGIAWASAKGIVNGMGNNRYEPDTPVTREQLVTMLYRFEKDYRKVAVPAAGSLNHFIDGAKVSAWAQDAMRWAVGAGLIQGRNTGHLDPAGTATRAEVATILQRFAARM